MTGYKSKKAAAIAKTIDEVNWLDHEPNGLAQPAQEQQVCCGEYDTCLRACTPRGRHLEQPKVRTGDCLLVGVCASEGHKIQAQRPWVGLTEDEIADCFKITPDQYLPWHIYKRIEAKLKEKSNG